MSSAGVVRSDAERVAPTAEADARAGGQAAMALDVFRELGEGNVAFSPLSLDRAFAMLLPGTRGATREQIARLFRYGDGTDEAMNALDRALADRAPARLDEANAVWAQRSFPFERDYLDVLARHHGAGIRSADFEAAPDAAREAIDAWVKERTRGRIDKLFPEGAINDMTRMVLVNALYLKAQWKTPFHEAEPGTFHTRDGPVEVPFMAGRRRAGLAQGDGWQAVELPYEGDRLAMTLIRPDDLGAFERELDGQALRAILDRLAPAEVRVRIPRFELRSTHALAGPLKRLGVEDAFGEEADLTGIADVQPPLFVADVRQKVFLRTDEAGTEGAAATGIAVELRSYVEPIEFDRPFHFLVRDRPTGAILFLGRVVDPGQASTK